MLGFLGMVVLTIAIVSGIIWIFKHFKGWIMLILILVLIALALGLIANPATWAAFGWFVFAAVCLVVAIFIIILIV